MGSTEGSRRIIVVDDEPAVRDLIALILEMEGHRVETFAAGEPAVARIERDPTTFDLVVTDVTMPRMTGAEVARRVWAARADVPVLFLSGHLADDRVSEWLDSGKAAWLQKPFDANALAAAVTRVLAGR